MKTLSKSELIHGIHQKDRVILSRAITLAESHLDQHRLLIHEVIEDILPLTGQSLRIGISGVPGVGKSTFIESFGNILIEQGKNVAVLTVDPSSKQSGGSILGDKTRMASLAVNENAYIRPSPAGTSLGGVASKTREALLLCEASGYEIIIIETVGVGQSETAVSDMVDIFLLLMLSGAGDELQGIKKGIMEMADILAINKADGDNLKKAQNAKAEYTQALHLFPPKSFGWTPNVFTTSSIEKTGLNEIWEDIKKFEIKSKESGFFEFNRRNQQLQWFEDELDFLLKRQFHENQNLQRLFKKKRNEVLIGKSFAFKAADQLIQAFFNGIK